MIEFCLILSVLGFCMGAIGCAFGLMSWIEWKSQNKSTHKIEFVKPDEVSIDKDEVKNIFPDFTEDFIANRR
jgi:hypothetical protein